ncbi:hypothetical protein PVAP13_2NG602520 [Panicum virgatum]|uniref:Uncharacterized protein n=1 Tax=Panicum virgatum TaxID=38727 RepID=A0A8T0VU48_PANVG|nr:hypothetical protein PVAP13_2NG602520 [Panicum virgatum]KAG2638559.1 hypothetical protein PVAP13_2NG602520 [Panicum virgatum]
MALGNRMAKPRGRPPWRCRLQRQGGSRQLHIREQTRGRDARRRLRKALSRIRRPWRPDPCPPAPDAGRRRRRGGGPVRWPARLPQPLPSPTSLPLSSYVAGRPTNRADMTGVAAHGSTCGAWSRRPAMASASARDLPSSPTTCSTDCLPYNHLRMHSQNRQGGHKPQGAASLDLRDDLNTPSVAEQRAAHWKVRWRLPEFAPAKVLDFGAEPSSVLWGKGLL